MLKNKYCKKFYYIILFYYIVRHTVISLYVYIVIYTKFFLPSINTEFNDIQNKLATLRLFSYRIFKKLKEIRWLR